MANPEKEIDRSRKNTKTLPYSFPRDGSIDNQHTVIGLMKYNRGSPRELPKKLNPVYIYLPLPMSGIEDNIALQYQDVPLGAVGGLLAPAKGIAAKAAKAAGGALALGGFLATSALGAAGDVLKEAGILGEGAAKFADQGKEALAQGVGMADNPNLSLSFQGVELRTHIFTWRLIAKSVAESIAIESIINTLKINALPQKVFGAGFHLGYPSIAILSFFPTNLIKISDLGCFITSINVKYDGDGYPVFFKGDKPVIIDLSVSFKERAIITSDDYYDYAASLEKPYGDPTKGKFIQPPIGG